MKNTHKRDFRVALRAIGFLWGFSLEIVALFIWLFADHLPTVQFYGKFLFITGLVVLAFSFLLSLFIPRRLDSVIVATIIGGSGLLAITLVTAFFSIFYFLVTFQPTLFYITSITTIILCLIFYCILSVKNLKQRMAERNFISEEFEVNDLEIIMRTPFKTDLHYMNIDSNSVTERLGNFASKKLIFLIPLAYPLQHALSSRLGNFSVLLLMAGLAIPLTFYLSSILVDGFYLRIYTIFKLQRRYRKKVVFGDQK